MTKTMKAPNRPSVTDRRNGATRHRWALPICAFKTMPRVCRHRVWIYHGDVCLGVRDWGATVAFPASNNLDQIRHPIEQ